MVTLDLSNWDLPAFDAGCLRAAGVDRVIAGCWHLEATRAIVLGCRDAGIVVEDLYCFLYFGRPWELREVENAVVMVRAHGGIRRVWLDIEAEPPNEAPEMTPERRILTAATARVALEREGVEVGIYTGEPYWRGEMANTGQFARHKLWLANWGSNDPANPRPPITAVSFGGWELVSVHQYSTSITVCGRARDHNYWMLEEEDMDLVEDLAIALYAGGEMAEKPRADRLAYARYRIGQALAGDQRSIRQQVENLADIDAQVYADMSRAFATAAAAVERARKGENP